MMCETCNTLMIKGEVSKNAVSESTWYDCPQCGSVKQEVKLESIEQIRKRKDNKVYCKVCLKDMTRKERVTTDEGVIIKYRCDYCGNNYQSVATIESKEFKVYRLTREDVGYDELDEISVVAKSLGDAFEYACEVTDHDDWSKGEEIILDEKQVITASK